MLIFTCVNTFLLLRSTSFNLSKKLLFLIDQLIGADVPPRNSPSVESIFGFRRPKLRLLPIAGVIEEIASNFNGIGGSNFQINPSPTSTTINLSRASVPRCVYVTDRGIRRLVGLFTKSTAR